MPSLIYSWNRNPIYERVRQAVCEMSETEMRDYLLLHAEKYLRITGTEGNWAGSSEMVALANALGRRVLAYGNNFVSQDDVEVEARSDGRFEVRPYLDVIIPLERQRGPPVHIFQTRGGGHYQ